MLFSAQGIRNRKMKTIGPALIATGSANHHHGLGGWKGMVANNWDRLFSSPLNKQTLNESIVRIKISNTESPHETGLLKEMSEGIDCIS
jgi:hypothetical protein